MLNEFAHNIWTVSQPQSVAGIRLGTRMTVIRLESGGVLLISPVKWTEELSVAVSLIGAVRFILCPNCYHHLFAGEWLKRFPDAEALAASGLPEKRPDLRFDTVVHNDQNPGWGESIEHECLGGLPRFNEVVIFHRPSRTLVVTDLLFHLNSARGFTAFYAWLNGCNHQPGVTRILKWMVKDRESFSQSIDRIIAWKPERLVLAHGNCIPENAAPAISEGLLPVSR